MALDKNARISFELFPPKTPEGVANVLKTVEVLREYNPAFFSVTYGAGGSTRDNTRQLVSLLAERGLSVAPHLSMGHDDQKSLSDLLLDYQNLKIDRIVALRGDTPSGMVSRNHVYAEQLVRLIRQQTAEQFALEVAAYPEIHPEASSYDRDIAYLKQKCDAGANAIITQYFYNADAYFYFVDACRKHGITQPIYPGIMPIINFRRLVRFSSNCGAEIPQWLRLKMESLEHDEHGARLFGEEVVTRLCEQLLHAGAPGIHYYTMNQSQAVSSIHDALLGS